MIVTGKVCNCLTNREYWWRSCCVVSAQDNPAFSSMRNGIEEVVGSIPSGSTNQINHLKLADIPLSTDAFWCAIGGGRIEILRLDHEILV